MSPRCWIPGEASFTTVLIFSNSALLVQIFSEREVELLERVVELLGRGEVFTNINNTKVEIKTSVRNVFILMTDFSRADLMV